MAMHPRLRRVLRALGFTAFYVTAFLLFAYLTFPYDRLRDHLVERIERSSTENLSVSIVELSPYWFTGIQLSGLRISRPSDLPNGPPIDTIIPSLRARVSILRLLIGDVSVSFEAEVPGGTIEGTYRQSFDGSDIGLDATFVDVNLRRFGLLRSLTPIPVKGMLSGTIELDLPAERNRSQGVVELSLRGMELGDGETRIPLPGMASGLTVDPILAGNFELALDVRDGVAHVRRFDSRGPDAELHGTGEFRLERDLRLSRGDLLLRMKFTDEYKNKSQRTQALFGLLEMNPVLRGARTPEGFYQLRVRGSVGTRFVPTPAADERWPAARR